MSNFELDLKDNAFDSFREAVAKYRQGQNGDVRAYKFCIQHLSHFMELIFKYYIAEQHPLLIYKDPFAENLDKVPTISLNAAINFKKNAGENLDEKFIKDLRWLKKLRNQIEHHKFTLNINQVQNVIGRLFNSFFEFTAAYMDIQLVESIPEEDYKLFIHIHQVYEAKVKKCLEKASGFDTVYHCYDCDHHTMIPDENSETGYRCLFCGNKESDDIEIVCDICGETWEKYYMHYGEWADDGRKIYSCPRCRHDPDFVKDD